ncbi:signal peptide peptidase SppA [Verrucomicrobiota bacterium]
MLPPDIPRAPQALGEPPRRRRSGKAHLYAIIVVESLLLALIFLGGMLDSLGREKGKDEFPEMDEIWSYGAGETKVVRIPLRGMIALGGDKPLFGSDAGSADSALKAIRRATHDEEVKAIIMDIDSGGGGITASDILYKALMEFKAAKAGRKIVSIFGDVAASGGYYVAMASDHVVARPTSITGSIGVLIQSFDLRGLGEKVGVKNITIKSGRNKDILNPLVELTEEQRTLLQDIVNELHTHFISIVAESRSQPIETIGELADGRIFTASRALNLKLVDQIGYWEDVMKETSQLLGVKEIKVFRYQQDVGFMSLLEGRTAWDPTSGLYSKLSRTRLLYLWQF